MSRLESKRVTFSNFCNMSKYTKSASQIEAEVLGKLQSNVGKACIVQLISAPIFIVCGMVQLARTGVQLTDLQTVVDPFMKLVTKAHVWSAQDAALLIAIMLLAEGMGQFLLAFSTWNGPSFDAKRDFDGLGEADRYKVTMNVFTVCACIVPERMHISKSPLKISFYSSIFFLPASSTGRPRRHDWSGFLRSWRAFVSIS